MLFVADDTRDDESRRRARLPRNFEAGGVVHYKAAEKAV